MAGGLAADDVAFVDGVAERRAGRRSDDRAERLRTPAGDDVPQHAAGDAADDQARGPVIAAAVVARVRAAVDAVVAAHAPRRIAPVIVAVVRRRIPVAVVPPAVVP